MCAGKAEHKACRHQNSDSLRKRAVSLCAETIQAKVSVDMTDQQSEAAGQRLMQAIGTLHKPDTPQCDFAAANEWLQQFEHNALAWKVCADLLQSSQQPYPALLYAAHTLRNKVRKQMQTLPSDALPSLRETLVNCINRHSADLQPVSVQLCIAMSALVLQWTQWEDVLPYLGQRLTQHNMALLLEYLPQEPSDPMYGKLMSGNSAYEWEAQSQYRVRPWCQEVIAWLTQVKPEDLGPSARHGRCRQLNCFAAWVRLGAIFEADSAQLDQLIHLAFQLTTSEDEANAVAQQTLMGADEFQAGSSAVLDILEFSAEQLHVRLMEVMSQLPHAAAQASSMSDMNKAERLCMVFTQFCDYNVSTLGSPSEMGSRLRSGLLQAALIPPYLDNEPTSGEPVALGPLATCQYLAEHLQTPITHHAEASEDMLSPEDTKAFFLQLLPGLLSNLQPLQEPAQQQLQLQLQDSPLRGPSTSLLAAICQLLGSQQYLQQVLHFAGNLANPAAPVNPKALEAALFAIVSAAEVLSSSIEGRESPDDEEAAQDVADTLLQLLLRLSSLSTSLGDSSARVQLVELQLMQTVAPALMHYLATQGGQAQDLMNFVLSKAGQLLQAANVDPALCLSAAQAIVQVCEVAERHSMPMPVSTLDGLLHLVQQATHPDVSLLLLCALNINESIKAAAAEQELAVALALCLSCIPAKPPSQPNREQYVSHLLQHLPASLQQLAHHHSAPLSTQQMTSANAAAERDLRHARTLMMFMQSWRDAQFTDQAQQSLNPAAQAFVNCWPLVELALSSTAASVGVKDRIAACCTAAVRVHLASTLPALPGILQAAAHTVASGSSNAHLWTLPLGAALDQLEGQQLSQLLRPLLEAITLVDSSAPAQSLVDKGAADQNPDFATSILNLTVTIARNAVKLHRAIGLDCSIPMLDSGLFRAAACASCNHKDVAASSLSCVSAIIEISTNNDFPPGPGLVYRAGPAIIQGMLAALLAVSALSRVHKVCSVLLELTGLPYPEGQSSDSCVAGWMQTSIEQLPPEVVSTDEKSIFQSDCKALIKAITHDRNEASGSDAVAELQSSTAGRNLKKCIRSFAERHQHYAL